jgi:hypothetical protein
MRWAWGASNFDSKYSFGQRLTLPSPYLRLKRFSSIQGLIYV